MKLYLLLTAPILFSQVLIAAEKIDLKSLKKTYLRPKSIPYLDDNKYSTEREILGKMLFFDPRVSGSNMISCATCHNPSFAWGDGLARGVGHGHKELARKSPTVQNLAWTEKLMWDGRFTHLEGQALGPIFSEDEMNMKMTGEGNLADKIAGIDGYRVLFAKAYPNEKITHELIGKALGIYERGLVSATAPFDKWISGNEKAITESAKRGFMLFNTKANCAVCHSGWNLTDNSFRDIGINDQDIGRGKFLKLVSQQHAFKTPGLRNINQRQPYMHNGSEKTLEGVINFYDRGGDVKRESLAMEIKPLSLTSDEKKDLKEFLISLTGAEKPVALPILPR